MYSLLIWHLHCQLILMRPVSQTTQSPSSYDTAPSADRELLVDIELFDAQGRWRPRNVVFCAAADPERAKKISTRCFRGLMAWYAKRWAKNYLRSHFEGKPESNALLQQIKQKGFVDNRVFRETVLRCLLLYEDLREVASGRSVGRITSLLRRRSSILTS